MSSSDKSNLNNILLISFITLEVSMIVIAIVSSLLNWSLLLLILIVVIFIWILMVMIKYLIHWRKHWISNLSFIATIFIVGINGLSLNSLHSNIIDMLSTIIVLTLFFGLPCWVIIYIIICGLHHIFSFNINYEFNFHMKKWENIIFSVLDVVFIFMGIYLFNMVLNTHKIITNSYLKRIDTIYLIYCIVCSILWLFFMACIMFNIHEAPLSKHIDYLKLWANPVISWAAVIGVTLTALSMLKGNMNVNSIRYLFPVFFAFITTPICMIFSTIEVQNNYFTYVHNYNLRKQVLRYLNHSSKFQKQSRRFDQHSAKFQKLLNNSKNI